MEEGYHRLILRAYILYQKRLMERLAACGLSPGQPRVLEYLCAHDGCMQKELAQGCLIEPASVTVTLAKLEREGLLTRRNRDGDRRALYVFLTARGWEKARRVCEEMETLEGQALACLSREERLELVRMLGGVTEKLTEMGQE